MIVFFLACRTDTVDLQTETSVEEQDTSISTSEPSTPPDELEDIDADGFSVEEDCDDWDPAIHPQAEEVFDHIDNNCDGIIDFDGIFVGVLQLEATAIYEGNPYNFTQSCTGTVVRERGESDLSLSCDIDLTQEKADILLGELLTLQASTNVLHDQRWTSTIEIASSNGWDSNGQLIMEWSDLSTDLGSHVATEISFGSVSLSLFAQGTLERE